MLCLAKRKEWLRGHGHGHKAKDGGGELKRGSRKNHQGMGGPLPKRSKG